MSQSRFGGAIAIAIAIVAEIPVIFFVAVMAAAVVHGGLHGSDSAIWATILIGMILSVVAVWAVLYFGFLRKRTPRRPVLSLAFLLILPVLATVTVSLAVNHQNIFNAKRSQDAKQHAGDVALADLAATVDKVVSSGDQGYAVDLHPALPGDPGRIEHAAKVLVLAVSNAYHQFSDARDALDVHEAMAPNALAAKGGLDKATATLVAVRTAVVERDDRIDGAIAACRKVLAAADIDAGKKRDALAAYDRRLAVDKSRRAAKAAQELDMYNEMMAIVGELKDAKGNWRVRRDGLEIDDTDVLSRIQRHWQKVAEIDKLMRAPGPH